MIIVYGYRRCSTVKKGLNFLENNNIEFMHVDNVEVKLKRDEIVNIHQKAECDIKKLFNTSGIKYRELGLKDLLPTLSIDEKYDLLASDGMLVKRPIIVTDKGISIGFKEERWLEII